MWKITAALLVAMIILMPGAAQMTSAATPTPTSNYSGLRPTPTPLTITTPDSDDRLVLNTSGRGEEMADTIINVYRSMNVGGVIDFIGFIFVGLLIIGLLAGMLSRAQSDD